MIHPTADVHETVTVGEDSVVWGCACVMAGTRIGPRCSIGRHSEIGRYCEIGEGTRISFGVFLPNKTRVGRHVFIGPRATFTDDKRPGVIKEMYRPEPPVIEDHAAIGAGAVILPGVRIGTGALVGAGAVVTRDVAPWTTVCGNPARPMKAREPVEG